MEPEFKFAALKIMLKTTPESANYFQDILRDWGYIRFWRALLAEAIAGQADGDGDSAGPDSAAKKRGEISRTRGRDAIGGPDRAIGRSVDETEPGCRLTGKIF